MSAMSDAILVDKVIERMGRAEEDGDRRLEPFATKSILRKIMIGLGPLKVSSYGQCRLNSYLVEIGANEMACLSAWALFIDLRTLDSLQKAKMAAFRAA